MTLPRLPSDGPDRARTGPDTRRRIGFRITIRPCAVRA